MSKGHLIEYQHTGFANSGRVAGIGIVEDNYSHDAVLNTYHHKSSFLHDDPFEKFPPGEVVTYKANGGKNENIGIN